MTNTYSKLIIADDDYDINEEEIDYLDDDSEMDADEYYYYLDYIEQSYD